MAEILTDTKPVVLTGLMGAGKSTVGKLLSGRMGRLFFDTDEEIEKAERLSVADIFAQKGEGYFRALEKEIVLRLLRGNKNAVVSLGGGAMCNAETLACIKDKAISVWLRADARTLLERARREGGRPLLDVDDPAKALFDLARKRERFYEQADVIIDTDDKSPEEIAGSVLDKIGFN